MMGRIHTYSAPARRIGARVFRGGAPTSGRGSLGATRVIVPDPPLLDRRTRRERDPAVVFEESALNEIAEGTVDVADAVAGAVGQLRPAHSARPGGPVAPADQIHDDDPRRTSELP
jgi:hypothetical protein